MTYLSVVFGFSAPIYFVQTESRSFRHSSPLKALRIAAAFAGDSGWDGIEVHDATGNTVGFVTKEGVIK